MKSAAILASFVLLGLALPALSQPVDRSGEARAAMQALRPMAGEWVQSVFTWRDDQWSAPVQERATIVFLLNDLALRERVPEHTHSGVKMETTIQFDQYRGIYRLVAMDDSWGNMDIYESVSISPGEIVFENIRPGTFARGPGGEEYYFRLTFTLHDALSHRLLVEISSDGGESWQNFQRLDRVRLHQAARARK